MADIKERGNMGKIIEITIRDKIAKNFREKEAEYICGNSGFSVVFDFDEEWDEYLAKTARFKYNGTYQDIPFTGNKVDIPIVENTYKIEVGVFAGNLQTTTSATIMAKKSILCGSGSPAAPSNDVYHQIMEVIVPEAVYVAEASAKAAENSAKEADNFSVIARSASWNATESERAVSEAKTVVLQAEQNTVVAKEVAEESARQAEESKRSANASEQMANNHANNASVAASRAENAFANIKNAEEKTSQNAQRTELAVQNFERTASQMESLRDEVAEMHVGVLGAEMRVNESAESAKASEEKAATSENNAKDSEQNAKTSEQNAAKSAEEARKAGVNVTAQPGQMICVKEVDENGKPTAWESVPWGYTESGTVEIVPETKTASASNEMFELYWVLSQVNAKLEVGKTYTIIYNGTPYECVCQVAPAGITNDPNAVAMGNFSVVGGANTGEPFAMIYEYSNICIVDLAGTTMNPVVGIYGEGEIFNPIPGTFLPEGVPYVEQGLVEIMPETDATAYTDPTFGEAWQITKAPSLTAGETYTIIYNGVTYDCVCHPGEDTGLNFGFETFALGNFSVVGGENTGEPFAMLVFPSVPKIACLDMSGATSVKIGIMGEGETIHKIDPRCLPDGIGVDEVRVVALIDERLGVIENGSY